MGSAADSGQVVVPGATVTTPEKSWIRKAIKELNGLLNGKSTTSAGALAALGGFFLPSDKAYAQILAGVRNSLGHDIHFENRKDREAIGNALVKHIIDTGGCVVTDDKAHGCRQ